MPCWKHRGRVSLPLPICLVTLIRRGILFCALCAVWGHRVDRTLLLLQRYMHFQQPILLPMHYGRRGLFSSSFPYRFPCRNLPVPFLKIIADCPVPIPPWIYLQLPPRLWSQRYLLGPIN